MRALIFACCFAAPALAAKHEPAPPLAGIKTPGVRIPIANLKPEAEIPAPGKPGWVFFSESAFAPNTKDGLDRIDAKTGKPAEPIAGVPKACTGMASAFGSLWAPACADGSLLRIDAKTYRQTAKIQTGVAGMPHGIAASADSLWLPSVWRGCALARLSE
jgi:virginiamycin B lyase